MVKLYNLIGQISQDDIVGLTLLQSDRSYRPGDIVTLQQSDRPYRPGDIVTLLQSDRSDRPGDMVTLYNLIGHIGQVI